MADLLATQLHWKHCIDHAKDNFKKIGRNNLTPDKVRLRISMLTDNWQQFNHGYVALTSAMPETKRKEVDYYRASVYDEVEFTYQETYDYMQEALRGLQPDVSPTRASNSASGSAQEPQISLAHLPPISLPQFDGKPHTWEPFRDRFKALIIDNVALTAVSRMHYLASCLTGNARDCVKNLPVTADSFAIAWKTLIARFENPRRILNQHLSLLLNLPAVTHESANHLQSLHDNVSIEIAALNNLRRSPGELWNDLLVHVVDNKLDPATRKAWNMKISDNSDFPSVDTLTAFIASRSRALSESPSSSAERAGSTIKSPRNLHVATASASATRFCEICGARHSFRDCPTFTRGNPARRRDLAKRYRRCFNCLGGSHSVQECPNKYSCRTCDERHHSLLHIKSSTGLGAPSPAASSGRVSPSAESEAGIKALHVVAASVPPRQILLSTAWVTVCSPSGRKAVVRAMLDSGSQITFLSERLAQTLHAKRRRLPVSISALGGASAVPTGASLYSTRVSVSPRNSCAPACSVDGAILPKLTDYAPKSVVALSSYPHLRDLSFADPNPETSDPINLIIGMDLYNEVLLDERRKGRPHEPTAQNSIFGWVISGPVLAGNRLPVDPEGGSVVSVSASNVSVHHCAAWESLDTALRRFWEIEELPAHPVLTAAEERCERHFQATHSREPNGRYVVRLPFKTDPPIAIGESRDRAARQLISLRRRLRANPEQLREYSSFLREYEQLGHMRPAPVTSPPSRQIVIIPHHAVIRDDSVTTHLRVVFNASSLTSNRTSLNDHLLCGAKLQTDLATVILRWRQHRFVYLADIAKMYRQIRVDSRDIDFQRILWPPDGSEDPIEYRLQTVTYGMACAPFLALRVLRQLIIDDGSQYPLVVPILRDQIYVDDVVFGDDHMDTLRQTRDQLVALLRGGGFELRKWASNAPQLLADLESSNHGLACTKSLSSDETLKVLGIQWAPALDAFQVVVALSERMPVTKRSILSLIARIYDPLGWLTPTTIAAKVLMQQLWREKIEWDAQVPERVLSRWTPLYQSFSDLSAIQLNRWVGLGAGVRHAELHGFADASSRAYAAVVFLKLVQPSGETVISLLAAKSRVAPLKILSVPRLELSGAVLLARLVNFVRASLPVDSLPCVCWTDSTVVLAWLRQHPSRWKVFVAHRVAEIQSRLPAVQWLHVPTHDNPADCASRGILGHELIRHDLWWRGPSWLLQAPDHWPEQPAGPSEDEVPEARPPQACVHVGQTLNEDDLATKFSSWPRLLRVTAYLVRFIDRCRRRGRSGVTLAPASRALTADEVRTARVLWVRRIQDELFVNELRALRAGRSVAANSSISSLRPFIDPDGILRVGGRIRRAPLPFANRHPILLASHPLVTRIIENAHLRTLHAGLQLTLSTVRRDFWIVRARSVVRVTIRRCVACARERAEIPSQIMGDLPSVRVTAPIRAFTHCGIDYAGPVRVRTAPGRGIASRKAYISLFVCMATRAVHLELVADCSTAAFRGAFSRFCSRRGIPRAIYSDNGTTFVGADRELVRAYRAALRDPDFLNSTASDNISWHFIPPSAPHFGGLWEAGVRSVKYHVRRVLGAHTLTFEEFTTLLCSIEACLNSRPLAPLTDSLDEYEPLTPGHFLIGSALTAIPEASTLSINENRLTRWQLVRHITEKFWRRWYSEYVNTLQQRSKWRQMQSPLQIGQLVLIRNSTLPPCKWELGRVTAVHPGDDGLTRVVTVKTATSEFKRPIVKLCVLPVDIVPETPSVPK